MSSAVGHGGAEKEAEAPAVALTAQCSDRRVHLRGSYASDCVSVCIERVHDRRDTSRRQDGSPRRRRTVYDPPVEPIDRGVESPVRSTRVDGNGAVEPAHGRARRVLHGSQVLHGPLTVAGVVGTDGETVIVVVRAASDLPESEPLWIAVVQPISQVAVGDVGLRLELKDRNAEVTADRRRARGRRAGCGAWESGAPVPNWLCTRKPR